MRAAITILYEGLHHLKHNDFALRMCEMFDHWIVVEGHSLPFGSTMWCNKLNVSPVSTDGTIEYMNELAKSHKNLHFYSHGDFFLGKDHQVNMAIAILKQITRKCFLFQIDADEQWTIEKLEEAEQLISRSQFKGMAFKCNHFVNRKKDLVARGEWGDGYFNRLWKWQGQMFKSHEPPILQGQIGIAKVNQVMFNHYSYVFKKDVMFKGVYYTDHEYVPTGWELLDEQTEFPVPISVLFGPDSKIGKTNSYIERICTN